MRMRLIFVLMMALLAAQAQADPAALAAVNAERQANGRAPLVWDGKLERAAAAHAQDMAQKGYFSHTAPNGSTMSDRIKQARYQACFAAENIAQGQRSLAAVMQSWMNSRGHRQNILNRKARAVGLAQAPGNSWVMVLGAPC